MTSRHGLANIGNTCYLNSAIQALKRATPFAEYFGTDEWKSHSRDERAGSKAHALATHSAELIVSLREPGNTMIVPRMFVKSFIEFARTINSDIRIGAQADAAEAIQILLDGLHTQQAREVQMKIKGAPTRPDQEELVKSLESWSTFFRKEYSPLIGAFYGQTQTRVICQACNATSTRYEPWSVMKVPIPGAEKAGNPAPTLDQSIAAAFASETIDDYACAACKEKGAAKMEHAISRFPKNIILSLKRFTNTGSKIRCRVPYDENLIDLSAWRAWNKIQPSVKYRVVSTIEHLGSSRGGHYIMRAREEGDAWMIYDDGSVSPCAGGGGASPDTYMLFLEQL